MFAECQVVSNHTRSKLNTKTKAETNQLFHPQQRRSISKAHGEA